MHNQSRNIIVLLVVLMALAAIWYFGGAHNAPPIAGETQAELANPASQHCIELDGNLELRSDARGSVGICHFSDGRACEEWALMRGEGCVNPDKPAATSTPQAPVATTTASTTR